MARLNNGLNRRHSCVDKRLKDWIDQSSDRLTFSRRGNRDERSIFVMWLDQDEHATSSQVLPGSLEGMNHARNCDSSKRPAEECDLEWVAYEAKPFGGFDPEGDIADAF